MTNDRPKAARMKRATVLLLVQSFAALAVAGENDWFVPLGMPPRAAPRHISGGEGVPPLPLPATPLRRTERKRDPSPPSLIGKVVWGESGEYKYADGQSAQVADWNLCPDDIAQLMRKAGRWFGLSYGSQPVSLASFDPDPATTPVLFFSGVRTLRLDDAQVALLRKYIARGGMIVFDSIAGSPYFYAASVKAVKQLVPEEPLRVLPPDHPIFHMLCDASSARVAKQPEIVAPILEGVYVGSHVACLVSRYGLGCGWDDHDVPLLEQARYYDVESANKLGVNIVAYAIGYADAARQEARPELFGLADEKRPTDELVFAQIRHGGAWNVHPGAAATLLRRMRQETALNVSLKRVAVDPGRDALTGYPFLYLEGLDEFAWDDNARGALRAFLERGGTLVVNNGLGLATFDKAFRREIGLLLPGRQMAAIAADQPLFKAVHAAGRVQYTPAVLKLRPDLNTPALEGIAFDGDWRVIYSAYDLSAAWLGCDYPLARGYEAQSGSELGMNLLLYAMTH
jgi:hypothetical protein